MMKSYQFLIISFLMLGTNFELVGQDIIDKISTKLCKCLEKEKVKKSSEMEFCLEQILLNNIKDIQKHYNAKTIDDINMVEVGNNIGVKLIKKCKYVINTFPNEIAGDDEKAIKQSDLKCEDIKKGNFYYLIKKPEGETSDTTFVSISDNIFLERMNNGRTYSLLHIKWKKDCNFNLIFKESDDPIKRQMSKPGDVYEYDILTNESESVILKTTWMGNSYQYKMIKIK